MNREQEKRRLRAGAFMVNNGRVLMTINLLREKYNALRSVEKGLKAEGIERQEFIDSVNFLHEEDTSICVIWKAGNRLIWPMWNIRRWKQK